MLGYAQPSQQGRILLPEGEGLFILQSQSAGCYISLSQHQLARTKLSSPALESKSILNRRGIQYGEDASSGIHANVNN